MSGNKKLNTFFFFLALFGLTACKVDKASQNQEMTTKSTAEINSAEKLRIRERAEILALIAEPRTQSVEVLNADAFVGNQRAFVEYFVDKIHPTSEHLTTLGVESALYQVARDRALFNDESEKATWNQKIVDLANERQRIAASPEYQKQIQKWAELSQGIDGELAESARRAWERIQKFEFSEAELPLAERLNKLSNQIEDATNSSPLVAGLAANQKAQNEVIDGYFKGLLPFAEAGAKLSALVKGSKVEHGQDFSTTAAADLQEAAVIRSQLARTKGFANWADFMLAQDAQYFVPEFQTVAGRVAFLEKFLVDTEAAFRTFLTNRLSTVKGMSLADLRPEHFDLLVEADSIVKSVFPTEGVETLWKNTMYESGFATAMVNRVNLDCFPRDKKYTHAYMMPAVMHRARKLVIDGTKGADADGRVDDATNWSPARIFIVQNFMDDGKDSIEVALHEGGHAVEYSEQQDTLGFGSTAAYAEVHSTFMERFLEDREFLASVQSRDGKKLSPSEIDAFIQNSKVLKLIKLREIAYRSLLDLKLWSYDFEKGTETFNDRARRIYAEEYKKALLVEGASGAVDWRNAVFMRPHFYSGWVMYFGYLAADLGAEQVYQYLLNRFEKDTGRRSLYRQSELGPILIEGLYRKGFQMPYPTPIETFTGAKYSVDNSTASFIEAAKNFQPRPEPEMSLCEKLARFKD